VTVPFLAVYITSMACARRLSIDEYSKRYDSTRVGPMMR